MKMRIRGWNRDMGCKTIAEHDLDELPVSEDENKYLRRGTPTIFKTRRPKWYPPKIEIAWFQELRVGGNYRMTLEFGRSEIMRLFKLAFGTVLTADLIEKHGFTVSPELEKAVLKNVKLADLTLGDLVKMSKASDKKSQTVEEPEEAQTAEIKPFVRRI